MAYADPATTAARMQQVIQSHDGWIRFLLPYVAGRPVMAVEIAPDGRTHRDALGAAPIAAELIAACKALVRQQKLDA